MLLCNYPLLFCGVQAGLISTFILYFYISFDFSSTKVSNGRISSKGWSTVSRVTWMHMLCLQGIKRTQYPGAITVVQLVYSPSGMATFLKPPDPFKMIQSYFFLSWSWQNVLFTKTCTNEQRVWSPAPIVWTHKMTSTQLSTKNIYIYYYFF